MQRRLARARLPGVITPADAQDSPESIGLPTTTTTTAIDATMAAATSTPFPDDDDEDEDEDEDDTLAATMAAAMSTPFPDVPPFPGVADEDEGEDDSAAKDGAEALLLEIVTVHPVGSDTTSQPNHCDPSEPRAGPPPHRTSPDSHIGVTLLDGDVPSVTV